MEDYPPDHNRVQWPSAATALWKSIRDDTPLPGTKPAPALAPTATPTTTVPVPVLTVRPDKITVRITNASGVTGRAQQDAGDLKIQGFHIAASSTGTSAKGGVTVGYSSQYLQAAHTVAAAFPGTALVKDESAGSVIQVTLGAGSPYVVLVPNRSGSAPLPIHKAGPITPTAAVTIAARTADSNIRVK